METVRVGDWVKLLPDYVPAWACGHVVNVTDRGVVLEYGGKDAPPDTRLFGMGGAVPLRHIRQVWRQRSYVQRYRRNGRGCWERVYYWERVG